MELQEPLLMQDAHGNMLHASNEQEKKMLWPMDTASHAKFLYLTPDSNQTECRLIPSGSENDNAIYVVNWKDQLDVLDSFNPDDVIGAELQFDFQKQQNFTNAFETQYQSCGGNMLESKFPSWRLVDGSEEPCQFSYDLDENEEQHKLDPQHLISMCGSSSDVTENRNVAKAFLNIYSYPRSQSTLCEYKVPFTKSDETKKVDTDIDQSKLGNRIANHKRLEVVPCEDFTNLRACVRAIRKLAKLGQFESSLLNPKTYFVVVNPFSGEKNALKLYKNTLRIMLEEAGVDHDLFVTEYPNHAKDRMREIPLDDGFSPEKAESNSTPIVEKDVATYDGLICVGGDGSLWEVLQGIRERRDYENVMKKITFGIVGCGTNNGLSKSILHNAGEEYGHLESIFLICKGISSHIDLSRYHTLHKSYTSFLTFSWAIVADVDIESERLRYLGSLRTDIYSVWRIINLRTYKARFSYLPLSELSGSSDNFELPSLDEPVPSNWVTIEDEFILFWASQVSHASFDMMNSPLSKLQDGVFQVLIIRKGCSRWQLIKMFLTLSSGQHVESEVCEFYACVAYRLEPQSEGSFNDLDGEVIESGPIQGRVEPRAMRFFTGVN